MKKLLVVVACLGMQSAYATKARMSALGQDPSRGSFYIEDNRNVWRSSNSVNEIDQLVTFEHGSNGGNGDSEGGFFMPVLGHQVGFYLNNDNYGNVDGLATVMPGRAEIFIGRPSFNNLGIRLGYEALNIDSNNTEGTGFDFGISGEVSGVNLWFNYIPGLGVTVGGTDRDKDLSYNLGASWGIGAHDYYLEYDNVDDDNSLLTLGVARTYDVDDGLYFYDLRLTNQDDSTGATDLNFGVGIEYQATSWLQWRLSIRQSIYQTDDAGDSVRDTQVGAGAALTLGNMSLEGSLQGVVDSANTSLGTDSLLSNVSVKYNF